MNRLLFLLFLFPALPVLSQETVTGILLGDSTYRRVILAGEDSLNCYLSYPLGKYEVLRNFGTNAGELARLEGFVRRAFSDTLVYVHDVQLTGYCSIDGTYAANERLSANRAGGMKQYLDREYAFSSRYPVKVSSVPEDWATLGRLVSASAYPWKEEALQIIRSTDEPDSRQYKLMQLDGGAPYLEMLTEIFPALRRVEIKVVYDLKRTIERRYNRTLSDSEFHALLQREQQKAEVDEQRLADLRKLTEKQERAEAEARARERAEEQRREEQIRQQQERWEARRKAEEAERERIREERRKFVPVFSIKTNLVSWAGLTPEFEHTTFMPNLAAEAFFLKRFSAELSAVYSNFSFGNGGHWAVSGYSVEPRFWLKGDGHYKGFFFGVYGQAGDFNVRRGEAEAASNHTGTYFDAGISAGYYLPLAKHLGAEFGLRGGYHSANSQSYDIRGGMNYPGGTDDANRFGLTRINVSLGYRF